MTVVLDPVPLVVGKTEVEVEELDPLAVLAAIDIERKGPLAHVGPLAKEQMPTAGGTADANRNLAKRLHRFLAGRTLHGIPRLLRVHWTEPVRESRPVMHPM